VFDLQGRFRKEIPLADMDAQSGLAVDSAGNVYVSDRNMGQVEVFGPEGQSLYRLGAMGDKTGQFNGPTGLWIESGCLYVADTGNRRVQEFRIGESACK
jgi:tripartite motif-containing protein 71